MEMIFRYYCVAIMLLVFTFLTGCSPESRVYVTNSNDFPIEVRLFSDSDPTINTAQIPPHNAARIGWVNQLRPGKYLLRVVRRENNYHSASLSSSKIIGEHYIDSSEKYRGFLHYVVEGSTIIASEKEPQDPDTLAEKRDQKNFAFYFVGILGCVVTLLRIYKRLRIRLR